MQLQRHVQNTQNPRATRKQLETDQNHVKAESEHRSSKHRPNFTSAEVEATVAECVHNAYLFIHLYL